MRLWCWFCGKSVSNEVPEDTVVRAVAICPECIEAGKITFSEDTERVWNGDAKPYMSHHDRGVRDMAIFWNSYKGKK
jgi:hypothetical protein